MINELGVEEAGLIKTVNGKPTAKTTLKLGHQDLEGAGRPHSPPAPELGAQAGQALTAKTQEASKLEKKSKLVSVCR